MTLAVQPDTPAGHGLAPPLPMYRAARDPDAWHEVKAPGGYEWWRFEAQSYDGRTHILAMFFDGLPLHPQYLRRYLRFVHNPTRRPPPVAAEYPCAYLGVLRDGRKVGQFLAQYRPGELLASADEPQVRIGLNAMQRDAQGVYHIEMGGGRCSLGARMEFRPSPCHVPSQHTFPSRAMTGADHLWILPAARCDVAGTLVDGPSNVAFAGRGYHDHCFGTGPIGVSVRQWMWGHAMTPAGALAFQWARPRDARLADEVCLVQADAEGARQLQAPPRNASARTLTPDLMTPPERLNLGEALRMWRPRAIDSSPFHARVVYEVTSYGTRTEAFCTIAYPHRLCWPILGRLLERAIEHR